MADRVVVDYVLNADQYQAKLRELEQQEGKVIEERNNGFKEQVKLAGDGRVAVQAQIEETRRYVATLKSQRAAFSGVSQVTKQLDGDIAKAQVRLKDLRRNLNDQVVGTVEWDKALDRVRGTIRSLAQGFVIGIGIQAVQALVKLGKELFAASKIQQALTEATQKYAKEVGKATVENNALFDKLKRLNPESVTYRNLLQQINEKWVGLIALNPGATLDEITAAQKQANEETQRALRLQTLVEINQKAQAELIEAEVNLRADFSVKTVQAYGDALNGSEQLQAATQDEINLLQKRQDANDAWSTAVKNFHANQKKLADEAKAADEKALEQAQARLKALAEALDRAIEQSAESLLRSQLATGEEIVAAGELVGKTLLEREDMAFENRLVLAGLFGKERETLNERQLEVLENAEKTHEENIAKIKKDARDKELDEFDKWVATEVEILERALDKKKQLVEDEIALQQLKLQSFAGAVGGLSALINSLAAEESRAAQFAKGLAVFEIGVQTAVAVANAIAQASKTGNLVAVLASAGLILSAMAQARSILAQSGEPPEFAEGEVNIQGPGGPKSDKIHAMISRGESVVPADATSKWTPELKAMLSGTYEKFIAKKYLMPTVAATLAGVAGKDTVIDISELERLTRKNKSVKLDNAQALGRVIAHEITNEAYYQNRYR